MASLGVKLPLTRNSGDGFTMIKSIKGMLKQNFKMLLLTIPGERVMEPDFGVGLKTYLFSNVSEDIQSQISYKIREQVQTYLPIISVNNIQFGLSSIETQYSIYANYLHHPYFGASRFVRIHYLV